MLLLIHFFGNSHVHSFTDNFTIIYNRDSSSYHVRFMLVLFLSHLWTEWYEIGPFFILLLATLICFFKASLLFIFFGEINCFLHSTNFALVFPKVSISAVSVSLGSIKKRGAKIFFTYKIERRDCSFSAVRL